MKNTKTKTYDTKTLTSNGKLVKAERIDPSAPTDPIKKLTEKIELISEAVGQLLELVQANAGMDAPTTEEKPGDV